MSGVKTQWRVNSDDDSKVVNAECNQDASTSHVGRSGIVDWIKNDSDETALLAHHYHICDVIENGPIYKIYRARSRTNQRNITSKCLTVKSFDLVRYLAVSGLKQEDIEKEVEICASLKHPFFCELKDVIYGSRSLHMVFEYVEGSDICFEIVKRVSSGFIYNEAVTSHYFRQLMEALNYLHSQNIVHRDIRPHNILLANKENNAPLKLRGFGVAHRLCSNNDRCSLGKIGIPYFMAPEIVKTNSDYGLPVDLWSAGVVLYILLFGQLPFAGSQDEIFDAICRGAYLKKDTDLWTKTISKSVKDLLSQLLCVDETKRLTAESALRHPWLNNRLLPSRTHLNETVDNIRKYNFRRKLKSSIVATANHPRWNRFPANSFLSADSVPGGDACDFDCMRKRPDISNSGDDMLGVQMILSSLDQTTILSDYSINTNFNEFESSKTNLQLESALNNQDLHELLLLYDRIRSHGIRPSLINQNGEQCLAEAKKEIKIANYSVELNELVTLLNNAYLHALFQAQDVVIEEVFASSLSAKPSTSSFSFSHQNFGNLSIKDTVRGIDGSGADSAPCDNIIISSAQTKNDISSNNNYCYKFTGNASIANETLKNLPLTTIPSDLIADAAYIADDNKFCCDSEQMSKNAPLSWSSNAGNLNKKSYQQYIGSEIREEEGPTTLFYDNDNDDILMNAVSRVRLVQFQKNTEEPMGITLKITEDNRCFIARIMHGGMIHRQSTLHVGDEIREINGVSVANQSVDTLQQLLRDACGHVQFKIVPSYRSAPPTCEIYVRAQFDYDPTQDDLIPCPPAGVPFKTGDILQIISKDDHNWWQARFVNSFPAFGNIGIQCATPALPVGANQIAGLIPSSELQEWRTACLAVEQTKNNSTCMWFNKKKKYYTTKYLKKHSELFEQLDLVTYEEVIRLSSFRRKTLVLLGAHGVGRRHIKNTLIQGHPQRYAYPQPHTTRVIRKDEVEGKHYFFVSNDVMLADIQANEYLEYGTHEECMYGTKLETIRSIHRSGKMAILDVEPQALKVLRSAEYAPFVVFIAAPDLHGLLDPDGSLESLEKESELLKQAFGHLFDYIICNNDIDETIRQLEVIVEKLNAVPQWIPVSWVY